MGSGLPASLCRTSLLSLEDWRLPPAAPDGCADAPATCADGDASLSLVISAAQVDGTIWLVVEHNPKI
jgi:hypothetical protein